MVLSQSAGPQYDMTLGRRRLSVGFFQSWHGPPKFDIFYLEFGPHPKNSGPNPMSFQFFTRGTWCPQKARTLP